MLFEQSRVELVKTQSRDFGKDEMTAFNPVLTMPGPGHNKCGKLGYKWTITCVLVVQNTKTGTTLNAVSSINVVKTVIKYGVVPRDSHVSFVPLLLIIKDLKQSFKSVKLVSFVERESPSLSLSLSLSSTAGGDPLPSTAQSPNGVDTVPSTRTSFTLPSVTLREQVR